MVPSGSTGFSHLCVVHVELHEHCEPHDLVAAMDSVGDRMAEIIAAVTETVPSFEPARLREFPAEDVLLAPVELLAERLAAGPAAPGARVRGPTLTPGRAARPGRGQGSSRTSGGRRARR